MANLNRVMLIGNLTRDPQLKYLPSQTPVVEFGLAINRRFRSGQGEDREETTFVDCSAFGRQAEVINQYCSKGKGLFVEGRLKFDSWEDRQSGAKRSKLSVVVENFQFLGGRDDQGGPGGGGYDQYDDQRPREERGGQRRGNGGGSGGSGGGGGGSRQPAQPPFGDEEQFSDDDIPF